MTNEEIEEECRSMNEEEKLKYKEYLKSTSEPTKLNQRADELKCCGNCNHYRMSDDETCIVLTDYNNVCNHWQFDGLENKDRLIK